MKIRDHKQTMDLIDAEQTDIIEYMDSKVDKGSKEYYLAARSHKTLAESKKLEAEIIQGQESIIADLIKGFTAGALLTAGTLVINRGEVTGEKVLDNNEKGRVRFLATSLIPRPR